MLENDRKYKPFQLFTFSPFHLFTFSAKFGLPRSLKLASWIIRHKTSSKDKSPCLFTLWRKSARNDKQHKKLYSRFTLHASHLAAFTLSEVLITLGIIGVVAAMLIPPLNSSYQKSQTVAKLKKVQSTMSQAVRLSEQDNGPNANWNWGTAAANTRANFDIYFAPYLQIAKYCSSSADCGYTSSQPWKYHISNFTWGVSPVQANAVTVILSDGTIAVVGHGGYSSFIIDINGTQKPNFVGKDVFRFSLDSVKGFVPHEYGVNSGNTHCNSGLGDSCALKIMEDGWEIKDDYPYNF